MDDEEREETVAHEADEGGDADTPPGAPGKSDTPLGDTDQHSDANA